MVAAFEDTRAQERDGGCGESPLELGWPERLAGR